MEEDKDTECHQGIMGMLDSMGHKVCNPIGKITEADFIHLAEHGCFPDDAKEEDKTEVNPPMPAITFRGTVSATPFDPTKLHHYLSDEAGMSKDYGIDWDHKPIMDFPPTLPKLGHGISALTEMAEFLAVQPKVKKQKNSLGFLDGIYAKRGKRKR